ncbi:MAG: ABC transporter permease [Chloroflexi bacterium]|nr:ABC transporter permease [Chloroflexota bacterium]
MRLLLLIAALALLAPMLAPYDPLRTDPAVQLQPPGAAHALGTDLLGRDVFSRLLFGAQRTLLLAVLATTIAVLPGALIGLGAGSASPNLDRLIGVLIDAVLAFPGLMLALVVVTLLGSSAESVALATGISQLAPVARVVRAATISVRGEPFIEAAAGLGAGSAHVISRHLLPNIAPTLLVYTGVVCSYSILNNAALSFLGLGGVPGAPDWGVMLSEGRQAFRVAPWIALAPGVAITATIIMLNRAVDQLDRVLSRR